jgi:hypothetical protein
VRRAFALVVVLAACAHAPAKAPEPRSDGWRSMTWEDRHDTMTWVVLPSMARTFQEIEHTRDPELTCRTCHGKDAEARAYAMPASLPPLDPKNMPAGAIADAMRDRVVPEMTELVGEPVGCFTCHPSKDGR